MAKKKAPADFVKWLNSQLRAFRARRFEKLDVEALACELEGVVGGYRGEVRHCVERLIAILMRPYCVYGDWDDLRGEQDVLLSALEDSPSLAHGAQARIKRIYRNVRLRAELHGQHGWPKKCPWKRLKDLLAAVDARNAQYLALERARDADFENLRRAPWKSTS